MSVKTTNLGLNKPQMSDAPGVTIPQLAQNFDIIDSSLADIVTNVLNLVGDGTTDNTSALQNALNNASLGQTINLPKGDYKVGNITIPVGIRIVSNGGRLIGGTFTFSPSVAQEYNATLEGIWFKQCHFVISNTSQNINSVTFERCFIDGTDLTNSGSCSGDAIQIGQYAFDIRLSKTNIANYGGNGILIQGNSKTDLTGTVYTGTGVFVTLSDVKIFNCNTNGIYILSSCADGTSVHMSNVLLDHCMNAINTANNPRPNGAGEINIFGTNVRIELSLNKAIYNDGANIFIQGIWSMGNAASSGSTNVIDNNTGTLFLKGRLGASSGDAVFNASGNPTNNCIIDGVLGGGNFTNVIIPSKVTKGYNILINATTPSYNVTGLNEPDTNYTVSVSPSWNTTCYVSGKTNNGFTITFGTAPSSNNYLDWTVSR